MSTPSPAPREGQPARKSALRLIDVERHYTDAAGKLTVLSGANLVIYPGEMVAIVAPSGAGKSTLLHIAALLERPDAGEVAILGRKTGALSDAERTAIRRVQIGFVYQFHHLLPEFSAVENIMMPQLIRGTSRRVAHQRAMQLLAYMRINAPRLLLADEPTGNLDPSTSGIVFDGLTQIVRASKLAALIATHNHDLAARMDRRITLKDGKVVEME
jgi:lipoprotein-releasing system ATP-binding protein